MRVDLTDLDLFERNGHGEVLAWLRRNEPVYWHDEPDGPGFWVVTRHADTVRVYGDDDLFSSELGMRLDSSPEAVAAVSGRMLIVTDPPVHTELRQVIGRGLGSAAMPRIKAITEQVVSDVIAAALAEGELDFLEVARRIPNHVVCALLGLPREHWEWVGDTTTEAFDAASGPDRVAAYGELFLLFTELLEERRENPGDDIISMVATSTTRTGRALTDEEIIVNCHGVLTGANETTRYALAGGTLELARDPAHWEWLRTAGTDGIASAVEEILRWTGPGVHVLRTATRATELSGVPIAEGDRVTLWHHAANRDEEVFADAERFLLDRNPNRHVTFGLGKHFCIGSRVARMELATFLTAMLSTMDHVELAGEPRYNRSNFTWGLRELPVKLVPR